MYFVRPLTCTCIRGTEEARKAKTIAYSSKKNSTDANGCIVEEKPIK